MSKILIVGLGGFLGSIARYGLQGLVQRRMNSPFPFGTLAVNVLGCLAIGVVIHLVEDRSMVGPNGRLFVAVGILGGFTTFSTFGYETYELLKDGDFLRGAMNAACSVFLGLLAVWVGRTLPRFIGM